MRRLMVCCFTLLFMSAHTWAAEPLASEASVRELIEVTQSNKLLDGAMAQMDALMQASMKRLPARQQLSAEDQKIVDEMQAKMVALLKDDMQWKNLEPTFIDIYRQSFSQKEIDDLLVFYRSDSGKSLIQKMPDVMQRTMQAMQGRMEALMLKMNQIQQDSIAQLMAAKKAKKQ